MGAQVTGLALPPKPGALYERILDWGPLRSNLVDIRDHHAVARVVEEAEPEIVIHMAAQALVRESLRHPVETISTNVMGTVSLLEALRPHASALQAIVVVTSDKCYRDLDTSHAYVEDDRLGGKDPYSASKACTEVIAHSYRESFFVNGPPLVTARAGNVIGGGDISADRLLPDIVRAKVSGERLTLRYPNATRPWQHVLEPLFGYLLYAQCAARDTVPPALNLAPPSSSVVPVHMVVEAFNRAWGDDHAGWDLAKDVNFIETRSLNLDASLAQREIGWRPRLGIDEAIGWTAAWHKAVDGGAESKTVSLKQLDDYLARSYIE